VRPAARREPRARPAWHPFGRCGPDRRMVEGVTERRSRWNDRGSEVQGLGAKAPNYIRTSLQEPETNGCGPVPRTSRRRGPGENSTGLTAVARRIRDTRGEYWCRTGRERFGRSLPVGGRRREFRHRPSQSTPIWASDGRLEASFRPVRAAARPRAPSFDTLERHGISSAGRRTRRSAPDKGAGAFVCLSGSDVDPGPSGEDRAQSR
jgi:hypothetical protein